MSLPAAQSPGTPPTVDEQSSKTGLRAVAIFEAGKGFLVLVLAATLLAVREHIEDIAEALLYQLHFGIDDRFAQTVMRGAMKLGDLHTWTIAGYALAYSTVRFVEAWGLWRLRVWAEWFALFSGALYLPIELRSVLERATWLRLAVLGTNIVILVYMIEIRFRAARAKRN